MRKRAGVNTATATCIFSPRIENQTRSYYVNSEYMLSLRLYNMNVNTYIYLSQTVRIKRTFAAITIPSK